MSWAPGNRAMCVHSTSAFTSGHVLTVNDVLLPGEVAEGHRNMNPFPMLRFAEVHLPLGVWASARHFMKFDPHAPEDRRRCQTT